MVGNIQNSQHPQSDTDDISSAQKNYASYLSIYQIRNTNHSTYGIQFAIRYSNSNT